MILNLLSRWRVVLFACLALSMTSCYYDPGVRRPAAMGALSGATIGALIGSGNANWGKGALIGGFAGGLAGTMYGNARRNQYYRYQGYYR